MYVVLYQCSHLSLIEKGALYIEAIYPFLLIHAANVSPRFAFSELSSTVFILGHRWVFISRVYLFTCGFWAGDCTYKAFPRPKPCKLLPIVVLFSFSYSLLPSTLICLQFMLVCHVSKNLILSFPKKVSQWSHYDLLSHLSFSYLSHLYYQLSSQHIPGPAFLPISYSALSGFWDHLPAEPPSWMSLLCHLSGRWQLLGSSLLLGSTAPRRCLTLRCCSSSHCLSEVDHNYILWKQENKLKSVNVICLRSHY